jgi:hypothetical protein
VRRVAGVNTSASHGSVPGEVIGSRAHGCALVRPPFGYYIGIVTEAERRGMEQLTSGLRE